MLERLSLCEAIAGVEKREFSAEELTRAYLARIEALAGVPIDLISTGPDRDETIIRRHPFD